MFHILIAEDDFELCQLFKHVMLKEGYSVTEVANGQDALDELAKSKYDLIITDIMMPKLDGYGFIQLLRESGDMTPVLMITAKATLGDMQKGFLAGTDDYMVKPINIDEMTWRVKALLRRAQILNDRKLMLGNTIMEMESFSVIRGENRMILPHKEFMLLYKMASYPGRIFTRQQLMDDIWGYDSETDTHTVEVHIGRLREKLKDNDDFQIVTIRGVGYKVESL